MASNENLEKNETREVDPRNILNDLDGSRWIYFTRSLLTTSYPSVYSHSKRKAHGANKPPELMKLLIEFFTKPGGRVLDPFAGVGGTLIGAALCEPSRECVGIEVSPRWIHIYEDVRKDLEATGLCMDQCAMLQGDCREVMQTFDDECFQFIATDPPYNLHFEKTMCNGRYDAKHQNRRTDYDMKSTEDADIANLDSYDAYLDAMETTFASCYRVLERFKYMVVIVRNAYQKGRYVFTHVDISNRAAKHGFIPKGEIIWYQTGARLRPYGYPYQFVPNIVHQYILVLRKE